MYVKHLVCLFLMLLSGPVWAGDDCLPYKLTPRIDLKNPTWSKEVVQPLRHMDLLHGNVVATMVDNYDIVADITNIEDGYCVALKSVYAVVGYSNMFI